MAAWDRGHAGMMRELSVADPTARVPWYGPPMGVMSFVSARLMETWAHGQDIADALGAQRAPTDRLRHVAHLGVRARPFSYLVHGLDVPPGRIDVTLTAPSGGAWHWEIGSPEQGEQPAEVTGPAFDFCLVVTQRSNVADTGLTITGDRARQWMSIAQAFAGPPGKGLILATIPHDRHPDRGDDGYRSVADILRPRPRVRRRPPLMCRMTPSTGPRRSASFHT